MEAWIFRHSLNNYNCKSTASKRSFQNGSNFISTLIFAALKSNKKIFSGNKFKNKMYLMPIKNTITPQEQD